MSEMSDHLIDAPGPRKSTDPVWTHNDVEVTKEEVEDEVLDAVEEAKEDVVPVVLTSESVLPPRLLEIMKEKEKLIDTCNEITKPKPEPKPAPSRALIHALRKQDVVGVNRTCAACARRRPIDMFVCSKNEICRECE